MDALSTDVQNLYTIHTNFLSIPIPCLFVDDKFKCCYIPFLIGTRNHLKNVFCCIKLFLLMRKHQGNQIENCHAFLGINFGRIVMSNCMNRDWKQRRRTINNKKVLVKIFSNCIKFFLNKFENCFITLLTYFKLHCFIFLLF